MRVEAKKGSARFVKIHSKIVCTDLLIKQKNQVSQKS